MPCPWDAVDSDDGDGDEGASTLHRRVNTAPTPAKAPVPLARCSAPSKTMVETDFQGTGWWARPLKSALENERAACGEQARPLRLGTACSGTEAPAHGLKALAPLAASFELLLLLVSNWPNQKTLPNAQCLMNRCSDQFVGICRCILIFVRSLDTSGKKADNMWSLIPMPSKPSVVKLGRMTCSYCASGL